MDALRRLTGRKPVGGGRREEGLRSEFISPSERGMDVTFVTPRILIVGRPTARETNLEDRRINARELAQFLEQQFEGNYLLFNLSSKTRDQIDYSLFKNQVTEFAPAGRQDVLDDTPAIGAVFRFLYALEFWLSWDASTVAVVFCNTGLAASAFFVSAYLAYSGLQPSLEAAFSAVSELRTGDPGALRAGLWPTWLRVQAGVDKLLRGDACLPKVHGLSHIILSCPDLRAYLSGRSEGGGGGSEYPLLQLFHGPKVVWDSGRDCEKDESVRWDDDKLIAEVALGGQAAGGTELVLCGDYQLWVSLPPPPTPWPHQPKSPSASRAPGLDDLGSVSVDTQDRGTRGGPPRGEEAPKSISPRLLLGRWVFHTSYLEPGVTTLPTTDCDVFRPQLTSGFVLNLILAPVPPAVVAGINLDRLMRRSFLNLTGMRALQQGANDFSSRHYVFPDTTLLKQLTKEGIDATAAVCCLQRANNAMGRAREALDVPSMKDIFREAAAMRDLQLIRATLTMDEIAGVLSTRANMAVKTRGLQISDLDFSGLLSAAQLGNLKEGGKGGKGGKGEGKGGGRGGHGRGGKKHKKKKGKHGESDESESDSAGHGGSSGGSSAEDESEEEKDKGRAEDDVAALLAKGGSEAKLFQGDAPVKDEEEEEEEAVEEEGGEDWTMRDHPIFGAWVKALSDGSKTKAALLEELGKGQWNPALLDVDPSALVPDVPATTVPLKEWGLLEQYTKMAKVGLPRPMVEHKMLRDFFNPALLDADPSAPPSATLVTPAKKGGAKKPSIVRKKLHWVPIKGKVEGSLWGGPPGDLVAAAAQLITDEEEFNRLFIQRPEDMKKKKKKDSGGLVQLLDHKRAMNCGIALAKLHMPFASVVACLSAMSSRTGEGKGGGSMLTGVELTNLLTLSPSDEEVKIVKGYKGDVARLGPAEKFFLAVADVPACRARAAGLLYQFEFDERVKASRDRIKTFTDALAQVRAATRLHRLLKAVLVLGNKMNGIDAEHRKGTVKAFTVASLHQLYMTKAFDPTVSVLQYLFKLLRRVDPDLLRLGRDFPNSGALLGEAARLSVDTLSGDVRELREGLTALEATVKEAAAGAGGLAALMSGASPSGGAQYIEETVEVERQDSSSSSDEGEAEADGESRAVEAPGGTPPGKEERKKRKRRVRKVKRRVEPLPVFVSLAQGELGGLTGAFDTAVSTYKELVKWFREDGELASDDLFGSLRMFIQTWETQLKLLADKKRKEKAAKKRAKEVAKRKEELARKRAASSGSTSGSSSSSSSRSGSDSSSESESGATGTNSGRAQTKALSRPGGGGPPPPAGKHTKSTSKSTAASSDYELGSSTSSTAAGAKPAAWASGQAGSRVPGGEEEEEDDEGGAGGGGGARGGNPMGGLLAAIKAKAATAKGEGGGGGGTPPTPPSALLSAIQSRARGPATTATPGGSPPTAPLSKEDAGAKNPDGWRVGKEEGDDPEAGGRNALLSAILKKRLG